jgi:hypothetical protein
MIPKIIHFVWIPGFGEAPDYTFYNIELWAKLNPEYKVLIWEEKEVLEIIDSARVDSFRSISGQASNIKKADFARLEIILRFGGIYLDCDLEPHKSISKFLSKKKLEKPKREEDPNKKISFTKKDCDISSKSLILSREWKNPKLKLHIFTPRNRAANGVIMSTKENEILYRFLELHYKDHEKKRVLHYLGPHALTRFLERNSSKFKKDDLVIIPPQHFLWEDKVGKMPKWSISKHMGKNTWGDHSKHDFWNVA